MKRVGVVAIGRNENDRLVRCLASIVAPDRSVVYVDSGSTDGSVEHAQAAGANVVRLDMSLPFSAARARNAGFAELLRLEPAIEYVQFVDGDCVVDAAWLEQAVALLETRPGTAVVAGRRRELYPNRSIYNRLCDVEWDTPIGETKACGGDALMRVAAFRQVGGYRAGIIAGEEPELCVRLRAAGWTIYRMDAEMTLHDADMTRFGQWWKRNVRAGHAFAEGAALHGRTADRHWVHESRSNWVWGALLPLAALLAAWPTRGWSLVLLGAYFLLAYRVYKYYRGRAVPAPDARLVACFTVLGKLPQVWGQMQYYKSRLLRRESRIIEYKGGGQSQSA